MTATDTVPENTGRDVLRLIPLGAAARLLRPIHPHLVACASLSALAAVAGFVPFVAIAEIARVVVAAPDLAAASGTVWTWAAVGAAAALCRLLLLGLSTTVGHHADALMQHHLRRRIVERLGVLPLGWFRAAGSGRVRKAMTDDIGAMHDMFAHAVGGLVGAAVAVLVGVGYLVTTDWRMTLVTVATPAAGLLFHRFGMRASPPHMVRLIAAEERLAAAAVEYVDGIDVVRTFGPAHVLERFDEAMAEHAGAYRAFITQNRRTSAVNQVLGTEMTVLAVVLAAGLALVGTGSLSVVDLLPFLVVGVGLPGAIGPLFHGTHGLRTARMAAAQTEALLSSAPLPEPAHPRRPAGHDLALDSVSFSYDGVTPALDDISVVCAPGTVTALVGPSGAGKSTLAGLVARFYDVGTGAIRIGGVDVRDMSSTTLLSSMSLVFQDVALLRDTITENIRIGRRDATDAQVRAAAAAAQIHGVIERLPHGYDTVLDETDGGGLSGGERQRLTIARAILAEAPIVVLDEATAALDPENEAAVQDALSELVAGKTVIVIAHRLHTIASADRIVVLSGGRVAEVGTHGELLDRRGLYDRMWRAQSDGEPS